MIPVDYDAERNVFIVHARPLDTEVMKTIFGARYSSKLQAWTVPAFLPQALQLGDLFKGLLTKTPATTERLKFLVYYTEYICKARTDPSLVPNRWSGLYEHQPRGIEFMSRSGRALLADDMGSGKTLQSLYTVMNENAFPALVVCSLSMKYKWAEETEKWLEGEARAVVIDGTQGQRRKQIAEARELTEFGHPVVAIINYDTLIRHTKLSGWGGVDVTGKDAEPKELNGIRWNAVIVDEVHKIKDPKTKRARACWEVSKSAPLRLGLSGTPVVNSPDDLWAALRFISPDEAGSRTQFRERYCHLQVGWHGGIEVNGLREDRKAELFTWLDARMLRRTKEEIGLNLPPKIVETLTLDLTGKQEKAYQELKKRMLTELDSGLLAVTDPLVLVNRLRFVASAMPVLSPEGEITELTTPSNKIDALLDIIDQMPEGDPVVVFAESRKLVELAGRVLEARGLRCGYVTGAVSAQLRAVTVEEFQAGKLDAVLCTTGAGAEGITLTRADTLVFLQRSWSNVANKQAEDRIHRIGASGEFAKVYYLVSADTVDTAVEAAVTRKEGWLQEVVRDRDRLRALIGGEL